jgi:hypothetical protein
MLINNDNPVCCECHYNNIFDASIDIVLINDSSRHSDSSMHIERAWWDQETLA